MTGAYYNENGIWFEAVAVFQKVQGVWELSPIQYFRQAENNWKVVGRSGTRSATYTKKAPKSKKKKK